MKKCHDWYLTNREENKINVTKVLDIINNEEVMSQYKMIRRFQLNQANMNIPPLPPPPPSSPHTIPPGLTSIYTSSITVPTTREQPYHVPMNIEIPVITLSQNE